jgi:photosystem II stability/assembly factor-like uncharacterized protein
MAVRLVVATGVAMLLFNVTAGAPRGTIASASAAGIDGGEISWIAVSPVYQRTGLVMAIGGGCHQQNCLWASHDGGATWHQSPAVEWQGGRFLIAVSGSGHETLFSESSAGLQRSDDDGESWTKVGAPGTPTAFPTYASDSRVAVAAHPGSDYVLRDAGSESVTGSGGSQADLSFAFSPQFPRGGTFAPALLAAANPQNGLPVIQRCTAALTCSGDTTLAGASAFSAPGMSLALPADYPQHGTVFAQTGRGIYKSLDGGQSFTLLNVGQPGATATATPMLALAPGYREAGSVRSAYVAVLQLWTDAIHPANSRTTGGIYGTDDGGMSWRRLGSSSVLNDGATAVAMASDGRLFAGYLSGRTSQAGLLCSTDAGATWSAACPPVVASGSRPDIGPSQGSGHTCAAAGCGLQPGPMTQSGALGGEGVAAPSSSQTQVGAVATGPSHRGTAAKAGVTVGVVSVLVLALGGLAVAIRHAATRRPDGGVTG